MSHKLTTITKTIIKRYISLQKTFMISKPPTENCNQDLRPQKIQYQKTFYSTKKLMI